MATGHVSAEAQPRMSTNEPQNLITVTVQGLKTSALVDSGATLSLVSRTFYARLRKQRNAKSLRISSYNRRFITADSKPMHVSTALKTDIRIAGLNIPVSLTVIDNLCHPIILGMNFFNETKADIQPTNRTLSLHWHADCTPHTQHSSANSVYCG
jgi:predicted aspartyl protease